MDQWIEGVGNEVTACFVLISGLLAFSIYKFITSWHPASTVHNVAQHHNANDSATESNSSRNDVNSLYDLGRRGSYDEPQENALEITVRYRENSRTVFIPENKTLLDLKKYCFQKVLDDGQRVHMVYQGHLLRPDTAPLSEFTLDLPSTLICQISQPSQPTAPSPNLGVNLAVNTPEEFDISGILLPLLGLILFCCWLVAMSLTASISANVYLGLLLLSLLYVLAVISSFS